MPVPIRITTGPTSTLCCIVHATTTASNAANARPQSLFPICMSRLSSLRRQVLTVTQPITTAILNPSPFKFLQQRTMASATHPQREILPTNVTPTHYRLSLIPDFPTFKFAGKLAVKLDVAKPTSSIVLHALDLELHSASINAAGKSISSKSISLDEEKQTATLEFDDELKATKDSTTLNIDFTGILNDKMAGFYRSSYIDKDSGEKKWLATTQMEPTDARRAFPCWDEPAVKATFEVEITADKSLTVLSNMDVNSEKEKDGKKVTLFNPTPKMSTYLLAFVVGNFGYLETKTAAGVPVRVYAPTGMEKDGEFSLDLAAKTLDFFGKEFGSPYPLPKMDMVAIPDFSAGAMENWGLVTYRIVDLLFDPKTSGAATKERVAEVVQHELAHQWFGNLVTMDWWEGLWLNEGFATWMSWYSCDRFYPEWKVWEAYVTDNLQSALRLDGLRSSHPIEVPVKKADEINQIFDAISYSKGSCVIRMISKYLGEDVFMAGIRRYIKKHAYGNTQTEDLWAALSEESGKDISKVASIWTKEVGYPVLTVTEDGDSITIRQNRFLTTGDVKPEEDKTLYWILLALKTLNKSGKPTIDANLTTLERETKLTLPAETNGVFKLNANHAGIYRVAYTPERLEKLGAMAKSHPGFLSVEDRAGLVADTGALCSSGYSKTTGLLNLVSNWTDEDQYVVWDEINGRVTSLKMAWIFEPKDVRDALTAFTRELAAPKAKSLGWTFAADEDHIQRQFKSSMFAMAGLNDDPEIVKASQEMFSKWAKGDKDAIHPDLRSAVFAIAMKNGGQAEYDAVYKLATDQTVSPDERNTALRNLGRAKDPHLIQKTLQVALNEVKEQDIYLPFQGLRTHPEGIRALWVFAKENWETIVRKLPPGLSMLGTVVQLVTNSFCSEEAVEEIEAFFREKSTKGFDQGLAQSLDSVRAKAKWLERDAKDVRQWLSERGFLKGKL